MCSCYCILPKKMFWLSLGFTSKGQQIWLQVVSLNWNTFRLGLWVVPVSFLKDTHQTVVTFSRKTNSVIHCIVWLNYFSVQQMETVHKEYRMFKHKLFLFFKLCEFVLKILESIMYSNNAGFAGTLTFPLQSFQEDKRKRDRDHGDSEGEQEMKCQTPIRMELSPEKPLTSTLSKQEGRGEK